MSRAFVKEGDDDPSAGELPERPLNDHPNYVTPRGQELLQARLRELQEQRDRLKAEDDLQKVKLICGNTTCEEYRELKAVIDGKASY